MIKAEQIQTDNKYRMRWNCEVDRINERIELLKVGLSGIVKRYDYQTVQNFYRAYHVAMNAYEDYQEKAAKWENL